MVEFIEIRRLIESWILCLIIVFRAGFQFDYVFDWTILKYQQSQMAAPPSRTIVSDQNLESYEAEFTNLWICLLFFFFRAQELGRAQLCPLQFLAVNGWPVCSALH